MRKLLLWILLLPVMAVTAQTDQLCYTWVASQGETGVSGTLNADNPQDTWTLNAAAGRSYTVYLTLRDGLLASLSLGERPIGVTDRARTDIIATGPLSITVSTLRDTSGGYTLSVEEGPRPPLFTDAAHNGLIYDGDTISGWLTPGQTAAWHFDAAAGDSIATQIDGGTVTLYQAVRGRWLSAERIGQPGRYALVVQADGDYRLSMRGAGGSRPPARPCGVNLPVNTDYAGVIEGGGAINGTVAAGSTGDLYRLDLTPGTTIFVRPPQNPLLALTLLDADGSRSMMLNPGEALEFTYRDTAYLFIRATDGTAANDIAYSTGLDTLGALVVDPTATAAVINPDIRLTMVSGSAALTAAAEAAANPTGEPTLTDTDEPPPTATDQPTLTPTPDIIAAAQAVAAQRTAQAILDQETATAARLTQDAALNLTESANLTATATQWTRTPTPDLTASVEVVLRQWANETATQAVIDATATATLWTDTPTPTKTPTLTYTPTPTDEPTATLDTPTPDAAVGTAFLPSATPTSTPLDTPTTAFLPSATPTERTPVTPEEDSEVAGPIGDGSAYVFHEREIAPGASTTVELQFFIDRQYITATPFSPITPVAAEQRDARPLVDPRATATPRRAVFSEDEIVVPERVVVRLICAEASFDGCEEKPARIVEISRMNSWTWFITAADAASGPQNLRLEVWPEDRQQSVWHYDFTITVADAEMMAATAEPNDGQDALFLLPLVIGLLVVSLGGIGVITVMRRSRPRKSVFISYRRRVSWGIARTINDRLTRLGADVFIDVDDIYEGSFSAKIQDEIAGRDYFVLVLAPGTLESEWVHNEALYALEAERVIIPVLVDGFDLYGDELPDDLKALQKMNAITVTPEYVDAAIDRLAKFIGVG